MPQLPFLFKWSLLCPEDRHSLNEGGVLLWRLGRHQHPLYARTPPVFSIWHTSGKIEAPERHLPVLPHAASSCPRDTVRPRWDSKKKKKNTISIKTYKPCPNPLKQLKTAPSSLQCYWSSCCMLCGRFLSILADKKLTCFLHSVRMNWEYSTVHSRVTIQRKEKVLAEVFFAEQKKTMFAKFKTDTDLFQPSWSVLTFWFEAWSLQLCPITTLNHLHREYQLINQANTTITPGLNNNSKACSLKAFDYFLGTVILVSILGEVIKWLD